VAKCRGGIHRTQFGAAKSVVKRMTIVRPMPPAIATDFEPFWI
jgi:hypothetical protein